MPGTCGHSRTARYTGSPADRQADPLRKPTFQAGARPPRCTMISAESSELRPSRFAVALRAMTRRPRPRGWQLREGRGRCRNQWAARRATRVRHRVANNVRSARGSISTYDSPVFRSSSTRGITRVVCRWYTSYRPRAPGCMIGARPMLWRLTRGHSRSRSSAEATEARAENYSGLSGPLRRDGLEDSAARTADDHSLRWRPPRPAVRHL
jgi:hypothetical protein